MSKQGLQSHYKPISTQTVTVSATSAATSSGVSDGIDVARIVSTTACHYVIASSPTATTSDTYLPAGAVEYVSINVGEKIAFIQNAAGGTAYVTEVTQ